MRFFLLSIILSLCCITASKAQDASQRRIDSLGAVFRSLSDRDTNKVLLCNDIANGHYSPDSTIIWADRLLALSRLNSMPFYVVKAYGYYSWAYSMKGDPMTSLSYNYKSLILSDSLNNAALKAYSYYKIGNTYFELQNQERSSHYYIQAADVYASLSDSVWVANCYRALGENYLLQKMYANALEIYTKALEWDMQRKDSVNISVDYFGMGKTLYRKFVLNYSHPDLELLKAAKDYIYLAYCFKSRSIRTGYYSTRTLMDLLYFEQKYSNPDFARKTGILDSMRILTSELDSITLRSGNDRYRLRYHLSSIYTKTAFRDFHGAKATLDSLHYIIDNDEFKNLHDVYYLTSCNYYEAVGDYKSALLYKSLYDEYIFNEQSVDLAVEYSVNEMRMEYERNIAEKDARMQQFTTKVVFAISFIL
ncbi:MAG: tetratricopeptide repeat protein, partial [Bacteroidales bacterium]|nr:tetratricopeptide repeat protein [Bacteroidales bacterium]